MRIINQTADELILTHPSTARTALGVLCILAGGALFIVLAIMQVDVLLLSIAAFVCFGAGLGIVFVNAQETITLHKPSGTAHHHQKSLTGATHATHNLKDASHVEIVEGNGEPEVFIVFGNGKRVRIDYAHRPGTNEHGEDVSIAGRVAQFLGVPLKDATGV